MEALNPERQLEERIRRAVSIYRADCPTSKIEIVVLTRTDNEQVKRTIGDDLGAFCQIR